MFSFFPCYGPAPLPLVVTLGRLEEKAPQLLVRHEGQEAARGIRRRAESRVPATYWIEGYCSAFCLPLMGQRE